jgi:hypothetical protein
MRQQDRVINLLDQDVQIEAIPLPPDLPGVQPQGPLGSPVSEIDL